MFRPLQVSTKMAPLAQCNRRTHLKFGFRTLLYFV